MRDSKPEKGGQIMPQSPRTRMTAPRNAEEAKASGIGAVASVHAWLANEIGLRIVRGDYPPGTILPNEAKWSETFQVSRSAVREAIKMLMAKSLLASRPKIGSRVEPRERWNLLDRDVLSWYATSPDRETFLRTVQEFRHIIEPEATAFAALRRSDEQMAEISRACREMGEATTLEDELLVHPCDLDMTVFGKKTIFDFARHRRIEHYGRITAQTGVELPPEA